MDKVTSIDSQRLPVPSKAHSSKLSKRRSPRDKERWERAGKVYELRLAGKSPSEIAELLGLPRVEDVHHLLELRIKDDSAYLTGQDRDTILGMEMLRLDHLQAAVWPAAMMGDPKSVDSALKIIQTRAKLSGLDMTDPVVNKNLVLVMGDSEDDYIRALKATSDD